MTTTQEIGAEQLAGLDLDQGDVLRVIEKRGATLLVQIARQPVGKPEKRMGAGEWARKWAGCVTLKPGETVDDVRIAHIREKYGPL